MREEAIVISRYLVGKQAPEDLLTRYINANAALNLQLEDQERKVWEFCVKSPALVSLLDAGLSLSKPQSILRKKIYLMFAILESSVAFTEHFLPQQRDLLWLPYLFFRLGFAVFKAIVGLVLIAILIRVL